jgi:CIC family chloride channel protein
LLIGLIGYFGAPQAMGAGYIYIEQAMHNQFTWKMLGVLAGLKIVSTTLSFVSGTPGGMFAPTLFIGAMLGGAVGSVEHILFPRLAGSIGTYCLVGMGVLFAGFLRAPMTSVFMVMEVSGDYSIVVPVIVANTFAYVISRALEPTPIFDLLTRQDGLVLPSLEEQREESILRVEDAMQPPSGYVLDADETVARAYDIVQQSNDGFFLVRHTPSGWSSVTKDAIARFRGEGKSELTLGSASTAQRLPVLHPDLPLEIALRYVHSSPILPVVHRADFRRLEGVISQQDVLNRYKLVERED